MWWAWVVLLGWGCDYISKSEFEAHWDADNDGWPKGEDCDDADPNIFPFAPDRRGDGCNSDCGAAPDADGDDWPDVVDCGPNDPTIFPCAPDAAGDGVDHDCNGEDGPRTDACPGLDPNFSEDEQPDLDETCGCPSDDDACNTVE